MSNYVGRFSYDGKMVGAGKVVGGTLVIYDWRDGEFHYDPRHEKMYYEGEYDDISDEEFEEFKERMDAKRNNECADSVRNYTYYQDHDDPKWIVRLWEEKGKRRGEAWSFKSKRWFEATESAIEIADDIYDHHRLSAEKIEEITGVK